MLSKESLSLAPVNYSPLALALRRLGPGALRGFASAPGSTIVPGKCSREHCGATQVAREHYGATQLRPGALWGHASAPGGTRVPRKCAREHCEATRKQQIHMRGYVGACFIVPHALPFIPPPLQCISPHSTGRWRWQDLLAVCLRISPFVTIPWASLGPVLADLASARRGGGGGGGGGGKFIQS